LTRKSEIRSSEGKHDEKQHELEELSRKLGELKKQAAERAPT
jgi:hypothetical protein